MLLQQHVIQFLFVMLVSKNKLSLHLQSCLVQHSFNFTKKFNSPRSLFSSLILGVYTFDLVFTIRTTYICGENDFAPICDLMNLKPPHTTQLSVIFCFQALKFKEKNSLLELVDPRLGSNFNEGEALRMIKIALHCTNVSPAARPNMSSVVSMLEGRQEIEDVVSNPSVTKEARNAAWTRLLQDDEQSNNANQKHGLFANVSTTGSSTSGSDLYPISVSQYLNNRDTII